MVLRAFNKRNAEIAVKWLPTAFTYGTGATVMMLYMTDWKVVLQYVPFYGSKFNEE
ncbi:cytochrome b-c1 complex subunit 10-like [Odontomachus brunneus]|uniref:cytochrome b-c1 complex subunit 10-like n=1 Tax=Odontomachus brunneus TaxID=486640 RepID=UPI0013F1CAAD|nr:cytochrome b-c1 complex subunit 10-like [Odontomachus brunneus]